MNYLNSISYLKSHSDKRFQFSIFTSNICMYIFSNLPTPKAGNPAVSCEVNMRRRSQRHLGTDDALGWD